MLGKDETSRRLLSVQDLDPERWKPMYYQVTIDVPVAADGRGVGSINTNNQAFVLVRVGHTILGNTMDPETSGLYNDGQYVIKWADEQRNYSDVPVQANLAFGPHIEGAQRRLPYPVMYAGNHTITFEVTNLYTRVLTPVSENFRVAILLDGLADWGTLKGMR